MLKKKKISFDDKLPFTSHLEELRKRLIIVLIVVAVFFVVAFTFSEHILLFMREPIRGHELIFLSPTEAFFAHMKMSFFVALFCSVPLIFYEIWAFMSPGLLQKEKKYTVPFVISASLFFVLGLVFASQVIMPFGLKFLLSYKTAGTVARLTISQYLSFYGMTMLIFGTVFELPIFVLFLTKAGLIKPSMLTKNHKYAILVIFIVSAILTPPDVVTQILMSVPLVILYEISIVMSKMAYRKKQTD